MRRHRRHHELHQHVQPFGHGRRRAAGQESRRARSRGELLRQDKPRARIPRRHRLPRDGRPHGAAGEARILPRRLRMYDLYRQLGPAVEPGGRGRRDHGGPQRGRRAVRQPQLRVAHPSAGEGELPGVAAAGGRVRARRHGEHRPDDGSHRPYERWQAGDALRAVARAVRGQRGGPALRPAGHVQARVLEDLRRRRALEDDVRADGADLPMGREIHLRPRASVLRRLRTRTQSADRRRRGARARGARRLSDDRPYLSRGRDPAGQSGRPLPHRARRRAK